MKVVNVLFNHKKSKNDNKILGVERCFIDYAKYLILNGHEVLSISKTGMVFKDDVEAVGSKYLEVPALNRSDIFSILRIAFSLFRFAPDVVICHSGRAMSFIRAARFFCRKTFPIVAIDHGVNPKKFLKADYVLTVNSYFSKELIKAGKAPGTAFVIPNMIEIPADFVLPVKPAFRNPVRIGSLGRLYPEKYFDKMIAAIPLLRERGIECEYVIGGVGYQEEFLNQTARDLKVADSFKILGWTSDKKSFFDAIDIFILPSYGETFGIVLLEAMLYNTPIITSNSWGPDEIIQEGVNGLKVPREDAKVMPKLIADAVERLVKDQQMAKNLALKAHEKFLENYTCEKVGKKLCDILNEIVQKN